MRTLVWFRGKDLRLHDHGPLASALARAAASEVVPLFVLDPYFFAPERARAIPHRIQFLLASIESLRKNVEHLGSELVLVRGKSTEVVPELARKLAIDRVVAQRWCEPFARKRDEIVRDALAPIPFGLFEGETLLPPGSVRTGAGAPFSVFTPFARAVRKSLAELAPEDRTPLPAPKKLPPLPRAVASAKIDRAEVPSLASLGIEENPRVLAGGERAARERLRKFLAGAGKKYETLRDRMDEDGTSRLSQDLKFGTLSICEVWASAHATLRGKARDTFTNELLWREFTHHTLWDRPWVLERPFRAEFERFPWRNDEAGWIAWRDGKTGYPVVDAAARQLLTEGFVHNRARMIAASFLTKHLMIDFRRGEAHYLAYLTDGDWAQNDMGWQWSAGTGCDAQPYFRVFNPVTQGERFDPEGAYVKKYVPELARLDAEYIHSPWAASPLVLREAGIVLGKTYPAPIVDHAKARARYLELATKCLRG